MQTGIHPQYQDTKFFCTCGNEILTKSTLGKPEFHLEVCSNCHPFYTGKQKVVDTAGRVDRFKSKFGSFTGMDQEDQK